MWGLALPVCHGERAQVGDDARADEHVAREVIVLDAQHLSGLGPARLLAA